IDGNWYVCDYLVVFLHDTRCRQMEPIRRPNSVEPHRGILIQRCRPSWCLYRVVSGITAQESRPASVELMSRTRQVGLYIRSLSRNDKGYPGHIHGYVVRPNRD